MHMARTPAIEALYALMRKRSTRAEYNKETRILEFVNEDCNVEKVPVGQSGLSLLRRNPNKGGRTYVGFQINVQEAFSGRRYYAR